MQRMKVLNYRKSLTGSSLFHQVPLPPRRCWIGYEETSMEMMETPTLSWGWSWHVRIPGLWSQEPGPGQTLELFYFLIKFILLLQKQGNKIWRLTANKLRTNNMVIFPGPVLQAPPPLVYPQISTPWCHQSQNKTPSPPRPHPWSHPCLQSVTKPSSYPTVMVMTSTTKMRTIIVILASALSTAVLRNHTPWIL